MTEFLTFLGVALGALSIWHGFLRQGRIAIHGYARETTLTSTKSGWSFSERNLLHFSVRAHNSGARAVALKDACLRQDRKMSPLSGEIWALIEMKVDGEPFDLHQAPLVLLGKETRILELVFMTNQATHKLNRGGAAVDLIVTEGSGRRSRRRTALRIQVDVGKRLRVSF